MAAPAAAAVPSAAQILFFSNASLTDQLGEDPTMIAGLTETGATVTQFDGGDGSAAAWTAALEGKDVLVIPETDGNIWAPGGTAFVSDEAAGVLEAFVAGGGRLLLGANNNALLLSQIVGLDYEAVWVTNGDGPFQLQNGDPALPAELGEPDGTYSVSGLLTWSPDLLAGIQPLYLGDAGDSLAVGVFPQSDGFVATLAYDWYPGTGTGEAEARALWNIVLQALANVPVPVPEGPQLAATGVSQNPLIWIIGGAVLVLGVSAVVLARVLKPKQMPRSE